MNKLVIWSSEITEDKLKSCRAALSRDGNIPKEGEVKGLAALSVINDLYDVVDKLDFPTGGEVFLVGPSDYKGFKYESIGKTICPVKNSFDDRDICSIVIEDKKVLFKVQREGFDKPFAYEFRVVSNGYKTLNELTFDKYSASTETLMENSISPLESVCEIYDWDPELGKHTWEVETVNIRVSVDPAQVFGEISVPGAKNMTEEEINDYVISHWKDVTWGDPVIDENSTIEIDIPID